NFVDLFKLAATEELFVAQEKLAARMPKEDWENDEGLNNWAEEDNLRTEKDELSVKLDNLARLNENVQLTHKTVYAVLGQFSQETSLLKRTQKVTEDLKQYKLQLAQKESQLEQTIKDFQTKEQAQKQEYLQLLTKKDQDWESKLEEKLKKPPTVTVGTQTDLTIPKENTRIWLEKDIAKHETDIQIEQQK
ncbi:18641_t:CDS:2, partial [Gigaspora margarita]